MPRGCKPGTMPKGKAAEHMFKPGQSGNPSGQSKEKQKLRVMLDQVLLEYLEQSVEVKDKQTGETKIMNRLELMVSKLFQQAVSDDGNTMIRAQAEIFDRTFGKAKQPLEHLGAAPVMIVDDVPENPEGGEGEPNPQ